MSKKTGGETTRRKNSKVFPAACLIGVLLLIVSGAVISKKKTPDIKRLCRTSIFSWESIYLYPEQEERVSQAMESLGCGAVYQEVPEDIEEEVLLTYLKNRHDQGQDVYYLAGSAEWGVETDGASMLAKVETAAMWNRKAEGNGFTGIVWDVEPYLLDEWDESPKEVMNQYVKNCEAAYAAAKENGLSVILCIPFFYDNKGLEEELERLIGYGCDAAAVMNYNKRDEKGQIALEYQLARNYQKGLIHITELQEPGYHGLTENNTYYYEGIEGVLESWEALKEAYPEGGLGFSWHYLDTALTILERSQES